MSWIAYSMIGLAIWFVVGALLALGLGLIAHGDDPSHVCNRPAPPAPPAPGENRASAIEAALDEVFREDDPRHCLTREVAPGLILERRAHSFRIVRR